MLNDLECDIVARGGGNGGGIDPGTPKEFDTVERFRRDNGSEFPSIGVSRFNVEFDSRVTLALDVDRVRRFRVLVIFRCGRENCPG